MVVNRGKPFIKRQLIFIYINKYNYYTEIQRNKIIFINVLFKCPGFHFHPKTKKKNKINTIHRLLAKISLHI